jgi:aminopeptidase N
MARIRRTILADTNVVTKRPVIDSAETDYLSLLNRNSYEKGGFFLHMLRSQLGENAFFDGLRSYYAKHRHKTAVTDDLMTEVESASKQKLGWFFDQWLRKPGYPEVTATWSYDSTAHEIVIAVTQSARFGAFQFPLTIAVVDGSGVVRRATVQVSNTAGSTQPIRLPLSAPPSQVVLDPDVELLASLTVVMQ